MAERKRRQYGASYFEGEQRDTPPYTDFMSSSEKKEGKQEKKKSRPLTPLTPLSRLSPLTPLTPSRPTKGPNVPGSIAERANRAAEKSAPAPRARVSVKNVETPPIKQGNTPTPAPKSSPPAAPKKSSSPPRSARSILGYGEGEDNAVARRLREREEARAAGRSPDREIGNEKLRNLMKSMGMKKGGKVNSASKRGDGCAVKGGTKGRYI